MHTSSIVARILGIYLRGLQILLLLLALQAIPDWVLLLRALASIPTARNKNSFSIVISGAIFLVISETSPSWGDQRFAVLLGLRDSFQYILPLENH